MPNRAPRASPTNTCSNSAQVFADKGGTTLTATRAVKVLTDETGKAVGLRAEDAEGVFDIEAKSVILATGGWQCDKEMCTKYLGRHADLSQAQCVPYLDGSASRWAWKWARSCPAASARSTGIRSPGR